jgi:hypothetical protein
VNYGTNFAGVLANATAENSTTNLFHLNNVSQEQAEEMLKTRGIDALIVIPQNFSSAFAAMVNNSARMGITSSVGQKAIANAGLSPGATNVNLPKAGNASSFLTLQGDSGYINFATSQGIVSAIFDQYKNPIGTQRNLSPQHAKKAYEYVTTREKAFYPEIVLNIRDPSYVTFIENGEGNEGRFGTLEFLKDPLESNNIVVSRLDGNHRLWFVDGHDSSMPAVDKDVSFCFLIINDLTQELEVFRDINDNQMGMNTSHLHNIAARLLGEKVLKVTNPPLYIVKRLQAASLA